LERRRQRLGPEAVLGGDEAPHVPDEVDHRARRRGRGALARDEVRDPPPDQPPLACVRAAHDALKGRLVDLDGRVEPRRAGLVDGDAPPQHGRQLPSALRPLAQRGGALQLALALPRRSARPQAQAELLMLESGHQVPAIRLEPRRGGRRGVGLHQLDLDADEGEQELCELTFRPDR
jgi:hypothetical protein